MIFTDGAVEDVAGEVEVTIGGVAFVPGGSRVPEHFSAKVSRTKVSDWLRQGSKHSVFQAELLPVVVAAATWEQEIRDRDVLLFLDNEAARYAMVKGYTPVASAARLVGEA